MNIYRTLLLLLLCSTLYLISGFVSEAEAETTARVSATSLNVRSGPTTQNRVVGALAKNDVVTVLEEADGWSQVLTSDGVSGWVATKFLEPVDGSERSERDDGSNSGRAASGQVKGDEKKSSHDDSGGFGLGSLGGLGGISLRKAAKWGSLAGGVIFSYMAYSAKSGADDDYDEYKRIFNGDGADAAESKYQDAVDGDNSAQTRLIVGGLFFGLFALQHWVLDDPADGSADAGVGAGNGADEMLARMPSWVPQIEADCDGSVQLHLLHLGN